MNIALLLSGGSGLRLGAEIPKQYIEVGGRPIISYVIERLSRHEQIDALQIVAGRDWQELIRECLLPYDTKKKFRGFSSPGENRQLSIYHGLEDIEAYADEQDCIIICDAARPILPEEQITDCLEAMAGHEGVLPVLPMKDTVYLSKDGKTVSDLLKREEVIAGQAPEFFRFGNYFKANQRLLPEKILQINGSTEPAILAGMDIAVVAGEEANFKITTRADLERFQKMIQEDEDVG